MKATTLNALGIAALLALGVGPMSANAAALPQTHSTASTAAASKPTDKSMSDRIDKRLSTSATLKKYDLTVSVENGVATLTGSVATADERLRAGRLARVPGVTKVENKIAVDPNVAQKQNALSKTGEVITDAWITTKVKSQFIGVDALKGSNIDVDTTDHVVTLRGTVPTEAGRLKAMEIARTTDGVTRVVDALTIGPAKSMSEKTKETTNAAADKTKEAAQKTKEGVSTAADKTKEGLSKTGEVITDAWITTKVKTQFVGVDLLKDSNINVDTNDHVVTLKGTVMTAAGRTKAVDIAKKTEGVTRVIDQLTIGPKK